ncbi:nucleoside deaminase [Capnocytophaga catalasegens]|uniref:tRNA-specific adenosine deaminase n=1 Tax=Capnocytophaga catalasegens TaxID=1004260 RepID=A0AAV5AWZ6_9FLAO|nr:nucleoside deaminase [Capnocytophaga catalasegens]GIZ16001.1 tRNA-specific adenosine deaminase [Capnocytophaga catalasegens]GJM50416.1 tRNA-specific adenosine deaminase [Capnocytophaga catalasegens]GJM51804.1 tRNA-specific adenosine deaminase [Capnocytophaga catalasegens]
MLSVFSDEYFMQKALLEAEKALAKGEIPVGAVIVVDNQIIAKAYNLTEHLQDVTAHAEIQAITAASEYLGGKYLTNCTIYVTLEPCSMCAGALYWSRIQRVVIGASDPKRGFRTIGGILHPKTQFISGILEEECETILHSFFTSKR